MTALAAAGLTTAESLSIAIPLGLLLLTGAGSGIIALVKFTAYLTRSQTAQESTAKSNEIIASNLGTYIERNDAKVDDIHSRVKVLEWAWDHGSSRK